MDTTETRLHRPVLGALSALLIGSLACIDTSSSAQNNEWEVGDGEPPVADQGPVEVDTPEEWVWVPFPTSQLFSERPF